MVGRRFWTDPDRRRAASLSLLVHGALLLAITTWQPRAPETAETERYLVLDLGSPVAATVDVDAAGREDDALVADDVTVASDAPGRPSPGVGDDATGGDPASPVDATVDVPATVVEAADDQPSDAGDAPVAVPLPTVVVPAPADVPVTPDTTSVEPIVTTTVPAIEGPDLEVRELPDAIPIPTPSVRSVTVPLTPPQVEATVDAGARDLPMPRPSVSTGPQGVVTLPAPRAEVSAGAPRSLGIAPEAGVRAMRSLPTPSVRAVVVAATVDDTVPGSSSASLAGDAPVGGDAAVTTQERVVGEDVVPSEDAAGLATVQGDVEETVEESGAMAVPPIRIRETRSRPLAVLLDNAPDGDGDASVETGYPQAGLVEARWIVEMPVEGGATRLMAGFDGNEPAVVGPVRSARDYFVSLADALEAVLVHAGGSPSAMAALQAGAATSIDAGAPPSSDLFFRDASAADASWYTLFSNGDALRDTMRRLGVDSERIVNGFVTDGGVTPGDTTAARVDIEWSGVYRSGFRLVPAQGRYRWIRGGVDAVDREGTAVLVDAVLIARTTARALPGDANGLLYLALSGGDATLAWRGQRVEGRWSLASIDGGPPHVTFEADDGNVWPLEASKVWTAFVPQWAEVRWTQTLP